MSSKSELKFIGVVESSGTIHTFDSVMHAFSYVFGYRIVESEARF
ncbi:MAG: hypothetical protein NWE80_04675 [Candidatus Bathyarchaeota archaeon]|nr:hypothetical protein [Candidatus Bathyarchaeota archaeon]